jgi:DMSO/TMAO reductase YedYZ molybdopterin-dependent catalytic subunit
VKAFAAFGVTVALGAALSAQAPAASGPLAVSGAVKTPLTLTKADLQAMPRTAVTLDDHGKKQVYAGVLVSEILTRAGAPIGTEVKGGALATYVLASAGDGYQVLFSIGELDPAVSGSEIIVADTVDGGPLSDTQGPLRIVVPRDKRGARSIRMLQRLEVVRLPPPANAPAPKPH